MNQDKFLYDRFISMLFELDHRRHSCLTDLVLLKDFPSIMRTKLEDADIEGDVYPTYAGAYRHHMNAERMKRYLEQNIVECYDINNWELFIRLKNGDKFVYDSFHNIVTFDRYDNELTDEEETREFAKNLRKLLDHNFMTQDQLATKIGVDRKTINRYVNGVRLPDGITLRKMARALKCSIDDFFYKKY